VSFIELVKNPKIPTRDQILELQNLMVSQEQPEFKTDHYFCDGMYARKFSMKAGGLVVGKIHKKEHFFLCVYGQMQVWDEFSSKLYESGDIIKSTPGIKRVVFAITDCACVTVHRTDKIKVEDIEEEVIDPEPFSAYDSYNKIKVKKLEENL